MDSTDVEAQETAGVTVPSPERAHERAHPMPATYVGVAAILAIVTAIEIALFYAKGVSSVTITVSLLVLMVIKFTLVALWFMHLRFDRPIFRRLFVGGILLALSVYAIVLAASHVFPVGIRR